MSLRSKYVTENTEKLDIACNDIEYWKNLYYDLIFKRGSYVYWLKELNEDLRERIVFMQKTIDAQRDTILSWTKARSDGE